VGGLSRGAVVTLDVEKPVAGGRMLARHDGRVVLVWGALPGERVTARIDRVVRQMAWGTTVEVLQPSPDRRGDGGDWRCGGHVYAHAAYARQVQLKGEVILDALTRIARLPWPVPPVVTGSPETGYRMRTRLHVQGTQVGFFREESHELCDAGRTGQCLPATEAVITWVRAALEAGTLTGVLALDIAENVEGTERVCHLELGPHADPAPAEGLMGVAGVTGVAATTGHLYSVVAGAGSVSERLALDGADTVTGPVVTLRRDPRAFFQGNRHLLLPLVQQVRGLVPAGPVLDLYAGVGLFGLALAADREDPVTLVEGDPISGTDLVANAAAGGRAVQVHRVAVESYLRHPSDQATTVVVDPPRTGLSTDAVEGLLARSPARVVYVSCDPPTFARDVALFTAGGYRLASVQGFDLFPNTAHVEVVGVLTRG